MKEKQIWSTDQRQPRGKRETSLKAIAILFLGDDERLKKQKRGLKVESSLGCLAKAGPCL